MDQINSILASILIQQPKKLVSEICALTAPFAGGSKNGALRIPFPHVLRGNRGCEQWCSMMAMYSSAHLDYWLDLAVGYETMDIKMWLQTMTSWQCVQHPVPCVYYTDFPYKVTCKTVNVYELVAEYNMTRVQHFILYIWCIATFGIYLNDILSKDVFEIENMEYFLASRLFQGEVDRMLGFGSSRSVFIDLFTEQSTSYSTMDLMEQLKDITADQFNMLVLKEKQKISECVFLGNETPQVIAMAQAMQLSKSYLEYLEKNSSFYKVGIALFERIINGNSIMANVLNTAPENIEVKFQVASAPKIPNKDKTTSNTNPQFCSLFGGASTMVCDFGSSSSGFFANTAANMDVNDIRLI